MARTRAGLDRKLGGEYYSRDPTDAGYDLPGLPAANPALKWTLVFLVPIAILVPVFFIYWDILLEAFGLAMAPVGAIALIGLVIAYKRPRSLLFSINRWLSVVAFGALLFGTLSFFRADDGILADATLGGDVGMAIIGGQDTLGILRLIGIGLATIALFAPDISRRVSVAGTILFIKVIILFFRILQATYTYLTEWYARRQIGGWIKDLGNPPARRKIGGDLLFKRQLTQALKSDTPPGGIGTVEPPSPPPATKPEEAPPTGQVLETQQKIPPRKLWDIVLGGDKETKTAESILPPLDLLNATDRVELMPADNQKRATMIEEALASHGIDVNVVQINPGPTVTQFGVEPGWFRKYKEVRERDEYGKPKLDRDGNPAVRLEEVSRKRVKVDQIAALDKDLALALAAPSIRIEAPVPGKSMVGIEVPNASMGLVGLKEAIESPEFQQLQSKTRLALALGKGSAGEVVVDSLGRMPHLLIAGATGSGKSVCITSLISCLLMQNSPDEVRFVLIDPKRVELLSFSTLPHLITPVIVDLVKVVGTLKWITQEMDRRYVVMASAAARNIEGYNKKVDGKQRLPYLVVVIDELADLMSLAPYDVEQYLTRIAQMGRATGIHLIVATQRPSVDVITGLIKANFPTRLSFAVTSMMDSRVILDTGGAEKLLGRGDMLYLPSDASKPKRLQGVYVSEQEVERIVYFWGEHGAGAASASALEEISASPTSYGDVRDEDPFLTKARELAMNLKSISTSLLQRRLSIGYPRAARLIDQLEEEGVVGPGEPGKSRQVLRGHQEGQHG
ncbi:MAG: DNA translocase FtsK [Dehalococcoidia bacterium]